MTNADLPPKQRPDTATNHAPNNTPSLAHSTLVMGLGTLVSRITGFGRTAALAYALGAGQIADSYNLANNIPNVVYELVVGGILSATLVPVFANRFASKSEDEAWHSVSAITTLTLIAVIFVSAIIYVCAPWLIHLYSIFSTDAQARQNREAATFLLRIFAPQVAFYGFVSLTTALLQVKRKFGPPMFAPICNNIVVICMFLALPHIAQDRSYEAFRNNTWALTFLGVGTTAGVASMALFLVPSFFRSAGKNIRFVFDIRNEAVRTVLRMSGWTLGLVIANQVSMWLMLALTFSEHSGKTTVFLMAYTFFILPHGIFAVSIMNALQPELAELWAQRKIDRFRSKTNFGIRVILFFVLPIALGFCLLAHPVLQVLLQYGEMKQSQVHLTANVVIAMMVGLPGFSLFIFLTRVFQSMQDARTVFLLYVVQNIINVITAIPLFYLGDVYGLALSQSLAYTFAACTALVVLRPRLDRLDGDRLVRSLTGFVVPLTLLAVVVVIVGFLAGKHPLLHALLGVLSGALVYLGSALLVRVPEIRTFFDKYRNRLHTR